MTDTKNSSEEFADKIVIGLFVTLFALPCVYWQMRKKAADVGNSSVEDALKTAALVFTLLSIICTGLAVCNDVSMLSLPIGQTKFAVPGSWLCALALLNLYAVPAISVFLNVSDRLKSKQPHLRKGLY